MNSKSILSRNVWNVLGLPFDIIDLDGSVSFIEKSVISHSETFLSTPNLNFVIAAQSDTVFFQSVVDSDLSVADGMPIIWVARLLGVPLKERVAGSSIFEALEKGLHHEKKIKVFFFGGQKGVAEQAHYKLNQSSQGMVSCGFFDPGFVTVEEMSQPEIIAKINAAKPDFIVVALGAAKGQQWIQINKAVIEAPIISHLGAVINFVAGNVVRAPKLWQKIGLEWLWRIKQEPGLWRRYSSDGMSFIKLLFLKVIPLAIYDRYLKSTQNYRNPSTYNITYSNDMVIAFSGSIQSFQLENVKKLFFQIIETNSGQNIKIDFTNVSYIDGAFIANLFLFQNYLLRQQRSLTLSSLPRRIKRILAYNNVIHRFSINN